MRLLSFFIYSLLIAIGTISAVGGGWAWAAGLWMVVILNVADDLIAAICATGR